MTDENKVHATHCCIIHGCKYNEDNCPVVIDAVEQVYLCPDCYNDDIRSIEECRYLYKHKKRKCRECGTVYSIKPKHKSRWRKYLERMSKINEKNPPKCCGG